MKRERRIFIQEIELDAQKYTAFFFPRRWYEFEMLRKNCKGLTHSELTEIDRRLGREHNANSKTNGQNIT